MTEDDVAEWANGFKPPSAAVVPPVYRAPG